MRKITPIIIAIIFVASVIFIGFFGAGYDIPESNDVKDIEILNLQQDKWILQKENKPDLKWDDQRRLYLKMNGKDENDNPVAVYLMQINLTPTDPSYIEPNNPKVNINITTLGGSRYEIRKKDLTVSDYILSFYYTDLYTVSVTSADGTNITTSITISVEE
jgi:hypothetical protein